MTRPSYPLSDVVKQHVARSYMKLDPHSLLVELLRIPPLGGGGAKGVAGLGTELVKADHTIDLVTMWMPGLLLRESRKSLNLTRISCVRFNRSVCRLWEMPLYLITALPVLVYLCLRHRYALNHTYFIFPDGFLSFVIKKMFGLRYLVTAHGPGVPGYNPDRFKTAHRLLAAAWRRVVGSAETIVCFSKPLEQFVRLSQTAAHCTTIPDGIDTNKFRPSCENLNRILVVTRTFERKGVQYLIHALENFHHHYEVPIVGDGHTSRSLRVS